MKNIFVSLWMESLERTVTLPSEIAVNLNRNVSLVFYFYLQFMLPLHLRNNFKGLKIIALIEG
jgi:hypothetical protein